uniref:Uncharacterized protein n=1 Tax=Chlamydomonas euryale TaxID=1486919 RepID=A0A7R9V4Z7_9CHLO|mmetsp:Transcript_20182/g.59909  ORF Transcript_20182/g.59909 Transcript_20182/m.59909 type:complete len:563 (+) Transcript_20182:1627-3315(+)
MACPLPSARADCNVTDGDAARDFLESCPAAAAAAAAVAAAAAPGACSGEGAGPVRGTPRVARLDDCGGDGGSGSFRDWGVLAGRGAVPPRPSPFAAAHAHAPLLADLSPHDLALHVCPWKPASLHARHHQPPQQQTFHQQQTFEQQLAQLPRLLPAVNSATGDVPAVEAAALAAAATPACTVCRIGRFHIVSHPASVPAHVAARLQAHAQGHGPVHARTSAHGQAHGHSHARRLSHAHPHAHGLTQPPSGHGSARYPVPAAAHGPGRRPAHAAAVGSADVVAAAAGATAADAEGMVAATGTSSRPCFSAPSSASSLGSCSGAGGGGGFTVAPSASPSHVRYMREGSSGRLGQCAFSQSQAAAVGGTKAAPLPAFVHAFSAGRFSVYKAVMPAAPSQSAPPARTDVGSCSDAACASDSDSVCSAPVSVGGGKASRTCAAAISAAVAPAAAGIAAPCAVGAAVGASTRTEQASAVEAPRLAASVCTSAVSAPSPGQTRKCGRFLVYHDANAAALERPGSALRAAGPAGTQIVSRSHSHSRGRFTVWEEAAPGASADGGMVVELA